MSRELGRARSPDLEPGAFVLAIPLGSTEQHGPHLPLDTDTTIATELCRRLAACLDGVIVAPAVPYGSAGAKGDGSSPGLPEPLRTTATRATPRPP